MQVRNLAMPNYTSGHVAPDYGAAGYWRAEQKFE
jgi:hypothetical protein